MRGTAREARLRRHVRVRKRMEGNSQRPRLCVFRSLKHVYAQVVDDEAKHTLVSASSLDPDLRHPKGPVKKVDVARQVGALLAKRALEQGITQAVFDRGGYKYHGRVRALAEAAREAGLVF